MSVAQIIFRKVQELPEEQAKEVLDFVDFLRRRYTPTTIFQEGASLAQYAGMIKLTTTGQKRSLDDFDAASLAQDKI